MITVTKRFFFVIANCDFRLLEFEFGNCRPDDNLFVYEYDHEDTFFGSLLVIYEKGVLHRS